MPIYMDLHIVPGVTPLAVAEAHRQDLLIEEEYDCKCMTYWIDEPRGQVFCLIQAPTRQAVEVMHARAHGLIPHRIIEVRTDLVESFLGRIRDPVETAMTPSGLPLIDESAHRVLLSVTLQDDLLSHHVDEAPLRVSMDRQFELAQEVLQGSGTTSYHRKGDNIIVTFVSAAEALSSAKEIRTRLISESIGAPGLIVHAGDPVSKHEALFGDVIQLAERLRFVEHDGRIVITSTARQQLPTTTIDDPDVVLTIAPQDERLINVLFGTLEDNWQDTAFDIDSYCKSVAMSKSRLYRRTTELTGRSPNNLLRDFRLEKAREQIRSGGNSIAEISYASGFASPSYFAKCFKSNYRISPAEYAARAVTIMKRQR